jgi:hypothetical protein
VNIISISIGQVTALDIIPILCRSTLSPSHRRCVKWRRHCGARALHLEIQPAINPPVDHRNPPFQAFCAWADSTRLNDRGRHWRRPVQASHLTCPACDPASVRGAGNASYFRLRPRLSSPRRQAFGRIDAMTSIEQQWCRISTGKSGWPLITQSARSVGGRVIRWFRRPTSRCGGFDHITWLMELCGLTFHTRTV